MEFNELKDKEFFPYNSQNVLINFTKNFLELVGEEELNNKKDYDIIIKFKDLRKQLKELLEQENLILSYYNDKATLENMPKYNKQTSKEIVKILIDKIDRLLENRE